MDPAAYGTDTFDFVTKERTIWHPLEQTFTQIIDGDLDDDGIPNFCLLYTSPSPRDATLSRMPSSA